jgi:endonuclease YncB( thermonuclease family)
MADLVDAAAHEKHNQAGNATVVESGDDDLIDEILDDFMGFSPAAPHCNSTGFNIAVLPSAAPDTQMACALTNAKAAPPAKAAPAKATLPAKVTTSVSVAKVSASVSVAKMVTSAPVAKNVRAVPPPRAVALQPVAQPAAKEAPTALPDVKGGRVDPNDAELMAAVRGADFTLNGEYHLAKAVDIYDGDTIRIVMRLGGRLTQFKARMTGYDSPEMKPLKSSPTRVQEKADAIRAKEALGAKINGKPLEVLCGDFDKYGRLLITVLTHSSGDWKDAGENVNQWMIANGHGYTYGGGTKKIFESDARDSAHPSLSTSSAISNP